MEEIEVLDEDFKPNEDNNIQTVDNQDIIGLDRLFSEDEEDVIDVYEENLKNEEIRQKRITKIQIGLIVFLAVAGTLIYFFGYDIVEPYIKIE